MRFCINVYRDLRECCSVEVEADNREDAIAKAIDVAASDTGGFALDEIYEPYVFA